MTTGPAAAVPTVVVVGGGVAGLAAAWALVTAPGERRVVLLEASGRTGGALAPVDLVLPGGAPLRLDGGAESLLARRPEAVELAREVGLGGDLVAPATTRAAVLSRGSLHRLPPGTLMGVPGDPTSLRGVLTAEEADRAAAEVVGLPLNDDVDVASWVAARLGPAVVERLVDPLLGGVYAGSASGLSLRAALPALWSAAVGGTSALDAVRGATSAAAELGAATPARRPVTDPVGAVGPVSGAGGAVFAGVRGGVWRLARALTDALPPAGATVRLSAQVTALRRTGGGWALDVGGEGALEADAVVLALPAAAASGLLAGVAPRAADELAGVSAATLALVTAVLPEGSLTGRPALAGLSGVLVPAVEGRLVKAVTSSSAKWAWVREAAGGCDVVRLSVGRHGEAAGLGLGDDELARAALADAAGFLGGELHPLATAVTRWTAALPQYGVGHVERIARVRAAVAEHPGLAVAGASYDGVGVPATIASARRAAREVLAAPPPEASDEPGAAGSPPRSPSVPSCAGHHGRGRPAAHRGRRRRGGAR